MFNAFFKKKTAYEQRISDWSSDVCSSDLLVAQTRQYTSNAQAAQQRLKLSEDTIASGVGLLQHVRELVVQANTATQSADTRKTIADQLSGVRDQLLALDRKSVV